VGTLLPILIIVNLLVTGYLLFLFSKRFRSLPSPSPASTAFAPVKIRLLKFNPFADVGGQQSFILCLLDSENSGVIITSLHTPSQTRVYAKPVVKGKADGVTLSREETAFLKKVINS